MRKPLKSLFGDKYPGRLGGFDDIARYQVPRSGFIQGILLFAWLRCSLIQYRWIEDGSSVSHVQRIWSEHAMVVEGVPLPAGHFLPEEVPDETAHALKRFFVLG